MPEFVQYGNAKETYAYDVLSRLTEKKLYNGNTLVQSETVSYVTTGGAEQHTTQLPLKVSYSYFLNKYLHIEYAYDSLNRITGITFDASKRISYKYDSFNRLVREDNQPLNKTYVYSYDSKGNFKRIIYDYTTASNPVNGSQVQISYSGNRLTAYKGEACVYDTIGNPTTYRGKTATWKGRQLQSLGGTTFTYDGKGRRIKKGSITYTYDSQGRLIYSSNGLEFFYGADGILGLKYNSSTYFYRKDIMGNIIAILDSIGRVVVEYNYDAWGNHTVTGSNATIGLLNPFRYRGYFYDSDTGLYYLQTRYYDPEVGRFLNMDSVDNADPETIGGLNLYAYCNNNPVMYVDPDGTSIILFCFLLGAIVGAIAGGAVAYTEASQRGITGSELAGWTVIGALGGGIIGGAAGAGLGLIATSVGGLAGSSMALVSGEILSNAQVIVGGLVGYLTLNILFARTGKSNGFYGERWPGDPHMPEHIHLRGNGIDIRIGRDGNPLPGEDPLSSQAKKALNKLWKQFMELFNRW